MAVGMEWAYRLTGIGLEFALPAAGGYWLDGHFGTTPLLIIVGAGLGFCLGMMHLLQIANERGKNSRKVQ